MFKRRKRLLVSTVGLVWGSCSSFCAFADKTSADQTINNLSSPSNDVSKKDYIRRSINYFVPKSSEGYLMYVTAVVLIISTLNLYRTLTAKVEESSIDDYRLKKIDKLSNIKKACEESSCLIKIPFENGYSLYFSYYKSPVQFANFRSFSCKGCRSNIIYAGASPWYRDNGRALAVTAIAKELGVGFEVNLECNDKGLDYLGNVHVNFENVSSLLNKDMYCYFLKLREKNAYIAIAMPCIRTDKNYGKSIAKALLGILKYWQANGQNEPVYVHCTEGRFRTGDLLSVLYLLAGEDIKSTEEKFLKSANNYFGKAYAQENEIDKRAFESFLATVGKYSVDKGNALFKAKDADERIGITRKYLINNGMEESKIGELMTYMKATASA